MPDLVKYSVNEAAKLAASREVPELVKSTIPQEDWDAMPLDEKQAAIEFFLAEQAETTEGLKITFPRVKYPTSGTGVFEIPSADGQPEYKPNIKGVIVAKRNVRAWWPLNAPIANNPPECFSDDSIKPNPSSPQIQAQRCDSCPNSQFGSGKVAAGGAEGSGRGQACKQRINVFILRDIDGKKLEDIPTLLSIPPSQLNVFSQFAVQVRKQGNFLGQCTEFGLMDTKSRDGTAYKGLSLKMARKLTYPEMQAARQLADAFRAQMESRGLVPDEEPPAGGGKTADRPENDGKPVAGAAGEVIDAQSERLDPQTGEKVPF
jgi:hypothetical protein